MPRFMQTSSVGGSSVTLQTAEAVNPHQPLAPALVMMLTPAANRAMPLRNNLPSTGATSRWVCGAAAIAKEHVIGASPTSRGRSASRLRAETSEFAQGLPQRVLGIFGARETAALQGRNQALADFGDVFAADERRLRLGDQKAIAPDLFGNRLHVVGDGIGRADHALEAARDVVHDQLAQRLAAAPLREGIERALLAIGGQRRQFLVEIEFGKIDVRGRAAAGQRFLDVV